jgi:hypothetical protein
MRFDDLSMLRRIASVTARIRRVRGLERLPH